MQILPLWKKTGTKAKESAIRVLNKKAFSLGVLLYNPGITDDERSKRERGLLTGADLKGFSGKIRESWDRFGSSREEVRALLAEIVKWRDGAPLPRDVRRCRYKPCSKFFMVPENRLNRVYCSKKCKKDYWALKATNKRNQEARMRKLKRVRSVLKAFLHLPDWKERTAQKAGVTTNWITYAISRKELNAP